jgi:hypothetical protein
MNKQNNPIKSITLGLNLKKRMNHQFSDIWKATDVSTTSFASTSTEGSCPLSEPRRGCLKKVASARHERRVRFSNKTYEKRIIPIVEFADELWWKKSELQDCQQQQFDLRNESQEVKDGVEKYIDAYMTAYDDVFQKTESAAFNDKISARLYKLIVEGRSQGYGGLELYCDQPIRRRENRNKVLLTVASYQYFSQTEKKPNVDSHVRSYSRSLTGADRYWASVIGNADAAAGSSE